MIVITDQRDGTFGKHLADNQTITTSYIPSLMSIGCKLLTLLRLLSLCKLGPTPPPGEEGRWRCELTWDELWLWATVALLPLPTALLLLLLLALLRKLSPCRTSKIDQVFDTAHAHCRVIKCSRLTVGVFLVTTTNAFTAWTYIHEFLSSQEGVSEVSEQAREQSEQAHEWSEKAKPA